MTDSCLLIAFTLQFRKCNITDTMSERFGRISDRNEGERCGNGVGLESNLAGNG